MKIIKIDGKKKLIKQSMYIETDGRNSFIETIGIITTPVAGSWTFNQDVYVRVEARMFCINKSSRHVKSVILKSVIQRGESDSRIVGIPLVADLIQDDELQDANAKIEVDGAAINIRVSGIENLTLTWAVQLEVEILRDSTTLKEKLKFFVEKLKTKSYWFANAKKANFIINNSN